MSAVRLCLLGPPRLERDGKPVELDTRKTVALVAYLAMTGQRPGEETHTREALATLLWPEVEPQRARANLRRSLSVLKKGIGGECLVADRETIGTHPEAGIWLDVARFRRLLNAPRTHGHPESEICPECLEALAEAVELYRGDFLEGFSLRDSASFDDWQFFQTEGLRQELAAALERLVRGHSAQGTYEQAIPYGRRWVALDPLHEPAHRQLMQLYALAGQRAAALRQYTECARILEAELGLPPADETTTLYEQIRTSPAIGEEPVWPTLGKRYRLDSEIGRGGMAVVYRGYDTLLERHVAVKILSKTTLDRESRARLLREAQAAAQLSHPNLASIHDAGEAGGVPFIVMELVEGPSLHDRPPRDLEEIVDLACQVCAALDHAHAHGIIHRDLKPENVLLAPGATAKLVDFGLAWTVASRLTAEGVILGTPFYLAPEQALGREIDHRADLYALGVMLYELTTGQVPFSGEDPLTVIAQHMHSPVVPPTTHNATIPAALDSLIVQLLSKRPEARPSSAAEVGQTLKAVLRPEAPEETTSLYEQIRTSPAIGKEPVRRPEAAPPPAFLEAEEEPYRPPVFVARKRELALLDRFLDLALAGQGRVVFVTGDAGSGKTALVQEFARRAQEAHADLIVASGNCNAYTGIGDPYLPFREILELLSGDVEARWAAGAMTGDHARRLWNTLPLAVQALTEVGPDLIDTFVPRAALLERARTCAPGRADWLTRLGELVERKPTGLGIQSAQQSYLFEQYTKVLQSLARQVPLVLVLDDLQWADLGSISLLFHLGRQLVGSRILILGAYRPEEVALGRDGERHPLEPVVHELQRDFGDITVSLGLTEGRGFIEAFLDSEPNRLGGAFREMLYRQTRGQPLFTIELLRGLQEQGDLVKDGEGYSVEGPALDWDTLPARVEAVIAERIGRLAQPLQAALRVASVEGEVFTAEVVARVQAASEGEVVGCLSRDLDRRHRLVRAQGILWMDGQRLSRYRFRHTLLQRYLYNSLDAVERAHLHAAVGDTLETLHKGQTEAMAAIAGQLAWHFQEAGMAAKAIDYLHQAGDRAVRLCAYQEAIAHLSRGLELLLTLPDSGGEERRLERDQQELALQLSMGTAWIRRGALGPEQAGPAFARARELCEQMGKESQLCQVLGELAVFHYLRAEHHRALELAEEALSLAQQFGDPVHVALGHWQLGVGSFGLGEYTAARAHLQQVISFYEPQEHHQALVSLRGLDAGVASLSFDACCLWALGYPEQASKRSEEVLALARELDHPFSLADGLAFGGCMYNRMRREPCGLKDAADELLSLSQQGGFPGWLAIGSAFQGAATAMLGQLQEGIAQMREGMAAGQTIGMRFDLPGSLCTLAEALAKAGQPEQGLVTLAEAFALVEETDGRHWEAELHRVQGELLLMQGDDAEAEASLHKAIEVARGQSAKSWGLRATTSLARLWQKQGKQEEARRVLAEIHGWFTEGFDTPDLQEAEALLAELANSLCGQH
jgi:predicted ATPase